MYNFREPEGEVVIRSCKTTSAPCLRAAPSILLHPNITFAIENSTNLTNLAELLKIAEVTSPNNTLSALPFATTLINCATQNTTFFDINDIDFKNSPPWKLYEIRCEPHLLTLEFASVTALKTGCRVFTQLLIRHNGITFQCEIQYPVKKRFRLEKYKCNFPILSNHSTPIQIETSVSYRDTFDKLINRTNTVINFYPN